MKLYIIRNKKNKKTWNSSIWHRAGLPTLYAKKGTANGVVKSKRTHFKDEDRHRCPNIRKTHLSFWDNAEVVECELIIPE